MGLDIVNKIYLYLLSRMNNMRIIGGSDFSKFFPDCSYSEGVEFMMVDFFACQGYGLVLWSTTTSGLVRRVRADQTVAPVKATEMMVTMGTISGCFLMSRMIVAKTMV